MNIVLHKSFERKYVKLRMSEKNKYKERRNIFLDDPFHPSLNNHSLEGKYKGYRSISIGGNLRVIYRLLNEHTVLFVTIDTHSNLYK